MRMNTVFEKQSPFSGKFHCVEILLDMVDYEKWIDGALIQNALPYLTADEREFLMTGITAAEWDFAFQNEK